MPVEFGEDSLGVTHNLSSRGAFIVTTNPMELGEQFLLKLHIPDREEPIEVACQVIWTNKFGKENKNLRRGMGVKFLNLQPEVQKWIDEKMKSNQLQAVGEILVGA